MQNYTYNKDKLITTVDMGTIIQKFQTRDIPILNKRKKMFDGKQPILQKQRDDGKPCNKIVCNFIKNIVDTYQGYMLGIPVSYSSNEPNFDKLQEILNYNDVQSEDSELLRDGLIFGRAAEICYIDEDAKLRFKTIDPREIIPIYTNDLGNELLYVIRIYKDETLKEDYWVELYSKESKKLYKSGPGFNSFNLIEEVVNPFGDIPFSIFSLNSEEEGISDTVFDLQNSYNSLLSDSIDDWDAFVDAMLVLKGVQADEESLKAMKESRCILLDNDADAQYLVKNTSTTEIEHLLDTVETKIREMSACPNFSNESFATSSGIAIKYRMMAMENKTAAIVNNLRKALQRRLELLAGIEQLITEEVWRDVNIIFRRNIPVDEAALVSEVNQLRGLIPDETLISLLPFVNDAQEELDKLKKQEEEKLSLFKPTPEVNNYKELTEDEDR